MVRKIISSNNYNLLLDKVGSLLERARKEVSYQVNQILVGTYREIGKEIVEFEQKGIEKAEYGSGLFEKLAQDLKNRYGKGFSRSNVIYMRLFYLKYPNSQTLSDQLSWSHYVELLTIDNDLERSFYEKQCINEKWSIRELKRQKNSALFERISLSKNSKQILELAKRGQVLDKAEDSIKDPYVLEFLGLNETDYYSERDLEKKIINNLQRFLLELGKGFTFVAKQFRITLSNRHYYVDLVFYHRILKCFVLIDLKVKEVTHADIGQMNMYLNYFKKEQMTEGDSEPIGIILTKQKDRVVIEYALGNISNKLFVSKYQLYLPDKKLLEEKIRKVIGNI